MAASIFCRGEGQGFSDDEFLYNKDGTLFLPHIHKKSTPHYASTGQTLIDPANVIPGVLLAQLHQLLARMPPADIEDWIQQALRRNKRG